jgi:hypothetical protein
MSAIEKLNKIKVMLGLPVEQAAPPPVDPAIPPAVNDDAVVSSYAVDGGQPVFVNNSDDGIAGIDKGDAAWADEAMTQPYPDGSYNVTGTNFSFTVSKGLVSDISDPDQKGAGAAVPDEAEPADMSKLFSEEFTAFKTEFSEVKEQFTAHKLAFAEAKATIDKQQHAITQLVGLVEQLAKAPVAEPLTPPQNFKSDKIANREERLEKISFSIKDLRAAKN